VTSRHEDGRRTYAVPFDRVWRESLALASGGMRRWSVLEADDVRGVIEVEVRRLLVGRHDRVRVVVGLDADGQTRVDVTSRAGDTPSSRGRHRRRTRRFCGALDRALGAAAGNASRVDPGS
jgi:hypothetical protein